MFRQAWDNQPWYQVENLFTGLTDRYLECFNATDKAVYFKILRSQDLAEYFGAEYIITVPQY
jgi:hypothetical protein